MTKKYPTPTVPGWYWMRTHKKTIVMVDYPEGESSHELYMWGIEVGGGKVSSLRGIWGPRIKEWKPEENE